MLFFHFFDFGQHDVAVFELFVFIFKLLFLLGKFRVGFNQVLILRQKCSVLTFKFFVFVLDIIQFLSELLRNVISLIIGDGVNFPFNALGVHVLFNHGPHVVVGIIRQFSYLIIGLLLIVQMRRVSNDLK